MSRTPCDTPKTVPAPSPAQSRSSQPSPESPDDVAVGDCLRLMARWPKESVDLIFADPPYNIGYAYDRYDDRRSDEDYLNWTRRWIDGCVGLLKPSGSIYILIGDEYAAETRLHLKQLQREGRLLFRNWIVWHYTFGQRCKVKYNRSHAHLFYCVGSAAVNVKTGRERSGLAGDPPFTFNYDAVAVPSARMTTYADKRQNPKGKLPDDTWYLKRFPAARDWYLRPQEAADLGPSFRAPGSGRAPAACDPPAPGSYFDPGTDTWYVSRLCGTFGEREQWHPCQLPEALLERIVAASSNPGDLVFDPFAGSGTTLAVAKAMGRHYLGCEMSKDYAQGVRNRLRAVRPGSRANSTGNPNQ